MALDVQQVILWLIYLFGSITFILGLKRLSHPETARTGNLMAAVGMSVAILGTIFLYKDTNGEKLHNHIWIFGGIIIGALVGTLTARRVKMTAMPQMVSLFNGMGGACAAIISIVEYQKYDFTDSNITAVTLAALLIGGVSFSGSMVAFGKLNGNVSDKVFPGQSVFNMIVLLIAIALGVYLVVYPMQNIVMLTLMITMCLLYGVLFVLPIGGADMPVVISLLNSFTGIAAACGGFIYHNQVMLTGGILVGSAGTILTILMCRAMNRSLLNVIIGNFGGNSTAATQAGSEKGNIKEISISDAAILLSYSKKILIVPGYGLAVAQAQHVIHELEMLLEERGVEVKYAIHPVAGRMPGHMNVLLAEADVSYDRLLEMEDANAEFGTTDAVIVIGANDVVNPAAKNDKSSPIYGMPILEVENAQNVIVMKRSMNAGYAGIENELFYEPKTRMLFGDAKASLQKLVSEVKAN